jgi:hypothetical protein
MKVKYPHTPELYKQYKRRKTLSSHEIFNDETGEKTFGVKSWSYEYMRVMDKIDGKLFINNIPVFNQFKAPLCNLPYLVNEKNEVIKFDPLVEPGKNWKQITPYADGWLIGLDNVDDYEIGEYYYIMELEE